MWNLVNLYNFFLEFENFTLELHVDLPPVMRSFVHHKMLALMYLYRYSFFWSSHEVDISMEWIYLINRAKFPWELA